MKCSLSLLLVVLLGLLVEYASCKPGDPSGPNKRPKLDKVFPIPTGANGLPLKPTPSRTTLNCVKEWRDKWTKVRDDGVVKEVCGTNPLMKKIRLNQKIEEMMTRLLQNEGTGIGQVELLDLNVPNNPINLVLWRNIKPGGVKRVELLRADIRPEHLRDNRVNFPRDILTDMARNLDPLPDDEGGHLVASVLGGPPEHYNLIPQHKLVNRNVNNNNEDRFNVWYDVEVKMRDFLKECRGEGVSIQWVVALQYSDGLSGRPVEMGYSAIFLDRNSTPLEEISGTMLNENFPGQG